MTLAVTSYTSTNTKDPALWFIHPIGTSGSIWKPVVDLLAPRYSFHTVDLPGHGKSIPLPNVFTLEGAAMDVWEQMEMNKQDVVVVGHSIGGMIAQILAAKQPRFLKGLVLVATLAYPSDEAKNAMLDRAKWVRQSGMSALLQSTLERWFTPESLGMNPPVIAMVSNLLLQADSEVHAQAWEAISSFNSISLLPKIRIPTHVLVGDRDVSTPPYAAKVIVEHCPLSTLKMIPDVGHALPQEAPERFVELIEEFMKEIKG